MKNRRILLVIGTIDQNISPNAKCSYILAKEFVKMGFEVDIVGQSDSYKVIEEDSITTYGIKFSPVWASLYDNLVVESLFSKTFAANLNLKNG